MAKGKLSLLFSGLNGKVGGLVMRKKKGGATGEVVVSQAPVRTAAPSDAQLVVQNNMKDAVNYAKLHKDDSEYTAAAVGTINTGYQLAVKDAMKAPDIESAAEYTYDDSETAYEYGKVLADLTPATGDLIVKYITFDSPTVLHGNLTVQLWRAELNAGKDTASSFARADNDGSNPVTIAAVTRALPNSTDTEVAVTIALDELDTHETANTSTNGNIYYLKVTATNRAGKSTTFTPVIESGDDEGSPGDDIRPLGIKTVGDVVSYIENNI